MLLSQSTLTSGHSIRCLTATMTSATNSTSIDVSTRPSASHSIVFSIASKTAFTATTNKWTSSEISFKSKTIHSSSGAHHRTVTLHLDWWVMVTAIVYRMDMDVTMNSLKSSSVKLISLFRRSAMASLNSGPSWSTNAR